MLQSHGIRDVFVEVQFRTAAMDSWASREHKLFSKYDGHVPDELLDELRLAAENARTLDDRMQSLRAEVARAGRSCTTAARGAGGRPRARRGPATRRRR